MSDPETASPVPVLELKQVSREFTVANSPFSRAKPSTVSILRNVDLKIESNQTVGLVGESGSGKTTTARLILQLDQPSSGQVLFSGKDVAGFDRQALKAYRRQVQPVFQDPYSSLNPRLSVGSIVGEPLYVSGAMTKPQRRARVVEALQSVGLGADVLGRYPHEFSGGQRQRLAIARALTLEPSLLILDEPVSALDISIRAQVMNLLDDLRQRMTMSYLLISHDLDLVMRVADRVEVMYLGTIVESGPAQCIARERRHPYTRALFASKLPNHPANRQDIAPIGGELASPLNRPAGCPFHPRCPIAEPRCAVETPPPRADAQGHMTACHLV